MRPLIVAILFASLAACSDPPPASSTHGRYRALVQRTGSGVPHVRADDLGSLGFGLGYASAQDRACTIADQILKVRSERARTFGAGEADVHVDSDLVYMALGLVERARAELPRMPADVRALLEGYAAGYNHRIAEVGPAGLPAPCAGATWVEPVSPVDLLAYSLDLAQRLGSAALLGSIAQARPPDAPAPAGISAPVSPGYALPMSNGWAIGRDRTSSGHGMLLANPHFPWDGELALYEVHLTLPGVMNVYGATLPGLPVVLIGFNEDVAWTHTVTPSRHATLYRLKLAPGEPTQYLVDGQSRSMTAEEHAVMVKAPDGTIRTVSRTFWRSHQGPMLGGPGFPWTEEVAFTLRDANEGNVRIAEQWLRMNMAASLDELEAIQEEVHASPWVYTVATGRDGEVLLVDASRVPALSPEAEAAYLEALEEDPVTRLLAEEGLVLLDGSTSRDEWEGPSGPGLVPVRDAPRLRRTDFVMNANDPPWLTHPAEPLVDYPLLYGPPREPPSLRTRMNLRMLTERGPGTASGQDGRFSLEEIQDAILSNRSVLAEQLRAEVVARCRATPEIRVDGRPVDLREACGAIAAWDGRFDLDSVGALVFRELVGSFPAEATRDAGPLFAVPFDPDAPLDTPHTLALAPPGAPDPILVHLGEALARLRQAGFGPWTRLGDAQFTRVGSSVIPIHGGGALDGVANVVAFDAGLNSTSLPRREQAQVLNEVTDLTTEGYLINFGTSFLLAVELTPSGPRAATLLALGESTDPASPHSGEDTWRFAKKAWRPVLFREEDIRADPALQVEEVPRGAR